jgi:hypothetical protein
MYHLNIFCSFGESALMIAATIWLIFIILLIMGLRQGRASYILAHMIACVSVLYSNCSSQPFTIPVGTDHPLVGTAHLSHYTRCAASEHHLAHCCHGYTHTGIVC